MSDQIRVFISSKLGELDAERTIIREQIKDLGLEPVMSEDWPPGRDTIRHIYLENVRNCPIYLGLFYRLYSHPTVEEYDAAVSNPYREILIYRRQVSTSDTDPQLVSFFETVKTRHVYYSYEKPEHLLNVVSKHIQSAISRMLRILLNMESAAEGGLSFGPLSGMVDEPDPSVQFLKSLNFEHGVYEATQAARIIQHATEIIKQAEKTTDN